MLRELRGATTALALVVCAFLALVSFDLGIPGQELLQSLRFHIAALLFCLIVLLLAGGAWWRAVILLLPLMASLGEGASIIHAQQQAHQAAAAPGTTPLFRLLSFNLLNDNENGAAIADYIVNSGADIVLVMEGGPLSRHRDKVFAAYPYNLGCIDFAGCSTTILSKWPLTQINARDLSEHYPRRLVTAVADINGTKVNLVLAHMSKPYFDVVATKEAARIAYFIRGLDGPVLLAGDFNAAAWSDNIARLARREKLAPGPAYPATWPVELGPLGVPIDNVLARAPLVIESVRAMDDSLGSNHRGLISEISIAKPG